MSGKLNLRATLTVLIVSLVMYCSEQVAFADSVWVQWTGDSNANNHWYKRIDTPMTWSNAELYAESLGGYLATVTSEPENDFLFDTFSTNGALYATLGGFQPPGTPEPDMGWQWVTGEPWSYTNWGATQPDDAHGGQDYLTFWGNEGIYGVWDDDFIDTKPYPFIVEIPEPATVMLLGLGGIFLRSRKS